jgi:hypothetical protein
MSSVGSSNCSPASGSWEASDMTAKTLTTVTTVAAAMSTTTIQLRMGPVIPRDRRVRRERGPAIQAEAPPGRPV